MTWKKLDSKLVYDNPWIRVTAEDVGRCRFEQFTVFRGLLSDAVLWRNRKPIEMGFQAMNRSLKREAERVARERA